MFNNFSKRIMQTVKEISIDTKLAVIGQKLTRMAKMNFNKIKETKLNKMARKKKYLCNFFDLQHISKCPPLFLPDVTVVHIYIHTYIHTYIHIYIRPVQK
ncbi:unnamed protein product [Meganyctiphanes norvegica]|uniref:Uncharacterized protein n=1 Tax=Meganyctiphanes norvegica TaxID=48144 RepID=A0AAV2PJU8_MEGNR